MSGCVALTSCAAQNLFSQPASSPMIEGAAPPAALDEGVADAKVAPENWLPAPRASAVVREHKTVPARTVAALIPAYAVAHHGRRGCGSRGGPGYRLPNGRCASRRHAR